MLEERRLNTEGVLGWHYRAITKSQRQGTSLIRLIQPKLVNTVRYLVIFQMCKMLIFLRYEVTRCVS